MNKKLLVFAFVISLAFGLRIYKVTQIPPSLNWDEISIAYNAYSILKTGKDEWGQFFPVHFKSYGEYKLPMQVYISIPAIWLFGLNEFGVRITPVIYGTLTVLVIFFLTKELFQSYKASVFASFLLAISPWHIQLTRASFESSLATFWISLGVWFLIKGFKSQKWFIFSMIPFALSIFTYNSARVFTPIFLFTILLIYRKILARFKKEIILAFIVFTILLLPLIPFILSGERSARYKLVSITDDPGLIPRINENRGNSSLPQPFPRLIHNKISYVIFYFSKNYLSHFTPQFLFISGAPHKQHHVQGLGELYYFQAPFLLIGLYMLFYRKNKYKGILFSWVFLAFIPVSVTNDSIPHALRTLIAVPFYQIISGFGLFEAIKWFKSQRKKLILFSLAISLIVFVELGRYLYQYYYIYPKAYSRDWQYGYKQVVDYINKNKEEYDEIVFSRHYGEPHMFTLFFLNIDPGKYQKDSKLDRFETFDWVRVLRFDKFYFPDLGDNGTRYGDIVSSNPFKKILFIGKKDDFPQDIKRLYSIDFLSGERAFDIVESN